MATTTAAPSDPKQTAPYVPFRSFLTALDNLRQGHPPELDPTVWHSFSGGLQRQMYAAFKFLGLIDQGGAVRPELDALIKADDRRALIAKMLSSAYPELFSIDLGRATQNQFCDALRRYNVAGSTHKKASSFFLQAAKFSDIALSPGIQHLSKPGGARGGKRGPRVGAKPPHVEDSGGEDSEQQANTPSKGSSRTITLRGGGTTTLAFDVDVWDMTEEDQAFIFDLIRRMKEYERGNPKQES